MREEDEKDGRRTERRNLPALAVFFLLREFHRRIKRQKGRQRSSEVLLWDKVLRQAHGNIMGVEPGTFTLPLDHQDMWKKIFLTDIWWIAIQLRTTPQQTAESAKNIMTTFAFPNVSYLFYDEFKSQLTWMNWMAADEFFSISNVFTFSHGQKFVWKRCSRVVDIFILKVESRSGWVLIRCDIKF